jgi:hypothetical protein
MGGGDEEDDQDWFFQEEHVWPLTSSTSCYTGATSSSSSSSSSSRVCSSTGSSDNKDMEIMIDVNWATQWHTCNVRGVLVTTDDDDTSVPDSLHQQLRLDPLHSRQVVPLDDEKKHNNYNITTTTTTHCVGYSATAAWEALALLDVSKTDANTTTATAAAQAPPQSSSSLLLAQPAPQSQLLPLSDDDAGSVTVAPTATMSSSGGGARHHHRRGSSFTSISESSSVPQLPPSLLTLDSSLSVMNTVIGTTTTTTANSTDMESTLGLNSGGGAESMMDAAGLTLGGGGEASTHEKISQIILRQRQGDVAVEYSTTLDFRPLAVTVCEFPAAPAVASTATLELDTTTAEDGERSNQNFTAGVGIWLGSADNNKLHWLTPSSFAHDCGGNDERRCSLISLALLDDPAFQFLTPIMAIGFVVATTMIPPLSDPEPRQLHCLAVACQDGTIRLITFRYVDAVAAAGGEQLTAATATFQDIRHNQVIVDGPIVCLHLQQIDRTHGGTPLLHITVGSMCGYVAELYSDPETMEWQGPYMVAQGFWNARLSAEDPVLAVYTAGSTVFLGTQAGRCLAYQKQVDIESEEALENAGCAEEERRHSFQLRWHCQLPYPVHAVSSLTDDRLLVTTRRTVHIFRKRRRRDAAIVAAAARVKAHLLALSEEQEKLKQQPPTEVQKLGDVPQSSPIEAPVELPQHDDDAAPVLQPETLVPTSAINQAIDQQEDGTI